MSTTGKLIRIEGTDQYLDAEGTLYLWNAITNTYVRQEPDKGLSTNDFSNTEKERLDQLWQLKEEGGGTQGPASSVAWSDITGRPELYTQSEVDQKVTELNLAIAEKVNEEQVEQAIKAATVSVYRYKGSVPKYENLPQSGMENGWVYNVEDTGMNYAWVEDMRARNGGYWDPLGLVFHIEPIPASILQQIVEGTYGS